MGTHITVKIADSDKPSAIQKDAAGKAFAEIKRIEDLLSSFREDSAVAKINRAGTEEVLLDEETFDILSRAKYFSKISDGAFDITVMPLLELWGLHDKKYRVPTEEEIKETLKMVGSDKIALDKRKRSIRFLAPGMKIDLGGIAKGYASDRAIEILRAHGIKNALAACAGDIRVIGKRIPNRRDRNVPPIRWLIGIRDPRQGRVSDKPDRRSFPTPPQPQETGIVERLELEDSAVSTSGSYERYFEIKGKRYSHIIDPRTGMPVDNDLLSVTVIASDCIATDALSTAIFVLGKKKGLALANRLEGVKVKVVNK